MIDYSRPPEQRIVSGCQVCDVVWRDVDRVDSATSGRTFVIVLAVAVVVMGLLLWAAV